MSGNTSDIRIAPEMGYASEPSATDRKRIQIDSEADVMKACVAGHSMGVSLGLAPLDQVRLATAISELGRNVVRYAGTGLCTIVDESDGNIRRARVVVEDGGPRVAGTDAAPTDGCISGEGVGRCLPMTRRLVDDLQVRSRRGLTRIEFSVATPRCVVD